MSTLHKIINYLIFFLLIMFPFTIYSADYAKVLSQTCNGCHGPNGISFADSIPSIAGFEKKYFMRTMMNFKNKRRDSTIMGSIALGYKASDLLKISGFFSSLEWENTTAGFDKEKVLQGKKIHDELCEECHSENGKFQDNEVPRISGQAGNYLYFQMLDYQLNKETMPQPDKMQERLETLQIEDIKALSDFYASGS